MAFVAGAGGLRPLERPPGETLEQHGADGVEFVQEEQLAVRGEYPALYHLHATPAVALSRGLRARAGMFDEQLLADAMPMTHPPKFSCWPDPAASPGRGKPSGSGSVDFAAIIRSTI